VEINQAKTVKLKMERT